MLPRASIDPTAEISAEAIFLSSDREKGSFRQDASGTTNPPPVETCHLGVIPFVEDTPGSLFAFTLGQNK
jgi:hypothetical protein